MLDVGVEFFAVGGEVKAQAVQLPAIVGDDGKFVGGKEISESLALVWFIFSKISLSLSLNCSWLSRRIFSISAKGRSAEVLPRKSVRFSVPERLSSALRMKLPLSRSGTV